MTEADRRSGIKKFIEKWSGYQKEIQGDQSYWSDMLQYVFGRMDSTDIIGPQKDVVVDGSVKHIDVYIPDTRVLIEQKSSDKDLDAKYRQSSGELLTPYEQAKRYADNLPTKEYPNWIITCNFRQIHIYDMNRRDQPRTEILLENLAKDYYLLDFLIDPNKVDIKRETEISIKAGDLVGELYEKLLAQYEDPSDPHTLHSLNVLCVRIVFCLYAEDAELFGKHLAFNDYLSRYSPDDIGYALSNLFEVLNTPLNERKKNLPPHLAAFPYVNGGLFEDDEIEIPLFTEEIKKLLIEEASSGFDWNEISPTIFGASFESTLNAETRRSGGMHYTPVENIHKVIDPLFMDELKDEYRRISLYKDLPTKKKRLIEFHDKIASLTFLDPAAGSGNFLTESYLSLRRLENEIIKGEIESGVFSFGQGQQLAGTQLIGAAINPIKVSINQFYGIEINDFAVSVAMTALWIAESQMQKLTEDIIKMQLEFLPLKAYKNIVCENALRYDWSKLVSPDKLTYIMGNPPFVGARQMDKDKTIPENMRHQKDDMALVFGKLKGLGNLDYVSAWYKKTADYIDNTNILCAFVSTNSITQGEQPGILWKLLSSKGIIINFAYRTFQWDSEARLKAHVHCVIIGFSKINNTTKKLYDTETVLVVDNINPYLLDAPDIYLENIESSICGAPQIKYGSFALDDGNYTISEEEYDQISKNDPSALAFLKPFIGAVELLHGKSRYCVWLKDVSPSAYSKCKTIIEKVKKVQEWRSKSERKNTLELAKTPALFAEIRQPSSDYLAIPTVSSERRDYIPIQYLTSDTIASNQLYVVTNATLSDFAILMSSVHMIWVKAIAGRLKSDFRYSSTIVYNNFPWPDLSSEQRESLEQSAIKIMNARALYPDCDLATLYDPITMPIELRKAHDENDKAVMKIYGYSSKMNNTAIASDLMNRYLVIVSS